MIYTTSTMYSTYEEWKQLIRKSLEQLAAEVRSRKRRPAERVLTPLAVRVKPHCDNEYG